eukprot:g3503.t1
MKGRRLALISVAELERAVADAGIGELLFTQTLIIEGLPLTKKQRRAKKGAARGCDAQIERLNASLASAFGVLGRQVKVLRVREGLAVKKSRWFDQPRKRRYRSWRKKKPSRSEIDFEITTPDGPPCDDLEALLRGLARRSRDDEKMQAKPEDDDYSSSDDGSSSSSGGSDSDDSDSRSEVSDDVDRSAYDSKPGSKFVAAGSENDAASVTSEYTAGLVEKLAVSFAKLVSTDVGIKLEKMDEDVSLMAGATVPRKTRNIPTAGFLTRRAALVDALGSYLHKREAALVGLPTVLGDGDASHRGVSREALIDALSQGGLDTVGEDASGFVDYLFLQDTSGGDDRFLPFAGFLCGMVGVTSEACGFSPNMHCFTLRMGCQLVYKLRLQAPIEAMATNVVIQAHLGLQMRFPTDNPTIEHAGNEVTTRIPVGKVYLEGEIQDQEVQMVIKLTTL